MDRAEDPFVARTVTDPVCGTEVDAAVGQHQSSHDGWTFHFCSTHCKGRFDADPTAFVSVGAHRVPDRDEAPTEPARNHGAAGATRPAGPSRGSNGTRFTIAVLGLFLLAWVVTVVVLLLSG